MTRVIELDKPAIEKVSIVCPFFNEELIIEKAVSECLSILEKTSLDWELILVNDGSTDNSLEEVKEAVGENERVTIINYSINQGRGHALKTGITHAGGDIIVTTEVDLSWGEDIVERIVEKFRSEPALEAVVASPNIKGGGYKNVPLYRILLSRYGNTLIRYLFTRKITMNTGMTRGYRKEIIQHLDTHEKGKEFHLEVLLKLHNLGVRIGEVPAVLEWKDNKFKKDKYKQDKTVKRKSSTKIKRIIKTHLNFLVFARPLRYFWFISFFLALLSAGSLGFAFWRLFNKQVSIYMALVALLLGIFSLLFFGFGVISRLSMNILTEMWGRSQPKQKDSDNNNTTVPEKVKVTQKRTTVSAKEKVTADIL